LGAPFTRGHWFSQPYTSSGVLIANRALGEAMDGSNRANTHVKPHAELLRW